MKMTMTILTPTAIESYARLILSESARTGEGVERCYYSPAIEQPAWVGEYVRAVVAESPDADEPDGYVLDVLAPPSRGAELRARDTVRAVVLSACAALAAESR